MAIIETENIDEDGKMSVKLATLKATGELKEMVDKVSSRVPIPCPVHTCKCCVGSRSVLAHFLLQHHKEENQIANFAEIFEGEVRTIFLDAHDLAFRKNTLIDVIAYGGVKGNENAITLADRGLCVYNTFLPPRYEQYNGHLPLLIFACYAALCEVKRTSVKYANPTSNSNKDHYGQIFLWCASIDGNVNLKCYISIDKGETACLPVHNLRTTMLNNARGIPERVVKIGLPISFAKKKFVVEIAFLENGPLVPLHRTKTEIEAAHKKLGNMMNNLVACDAGNANNLKFTFAPSKVGNYEPLDTVPAKKETVFKGITTKSKPFSANGPNTQFKIEGLNPDKFTGSYNPKAGRQFLPDKHQPDEEGQDYEKKSKKSVQSTFPQSAVLYSTLSVDKYLEPNIPDLKPPTVNPNCITLKPSNSCLREGKSSKKNAKHVSKSC